MMRQWFLAKRAKCKKMNNYIDDFHRFTGEAC